MESKSKDTTFVKRALLLAGLVLVIVYFGQVVQALKTAYGILLPLALGFMIAYVVNILMRFLERHYFLKAEQSWIHKTKRPVCLLLSYVLILLILVAVITLVLPKVVDTIRALSAVLPEYWEQIRRWFGDHQEQWSFVNEWLSGDSFSWDSIADRIQSSAP
ncbi:MAG: AI-2E family transporter, partial [Firmicutes bacterium]|nr:AI-2E family transporter [Bacillota bacterium]